MAQAYEYEVKSDTVVANLESSLATEDAAGWEVVGYSSGWTGGTVGQFLFSALLRRRV